MHIYACTIDILWGRKCIFLLDSGADVSVENQETYQRIPKKERPPTFPIPNNVKVAGASGPPLEVRGFCNLPILATGQKLGLESMHNGHEFNV